MKKKQVSRIGKYRPSEQFKYLDDEKDKIYKCQLEENDCMNDLITLIDEFYSNDKQISHSEEWDKMELIL